MTPAIVQILVGPELPPQPTPAGSLLVGYVLALVSVMLALWATFKFVQLLEDDVDDEVSLETVSRYDEDPEPIDALVGRHLHGDQWEGGPRDGDRL